MRLRW
jgi:hypothetical protein